VTPRVDYQTGMIPRPSWREPQVQRAESRRNVAWLADVFFRFSIFAFVACAILAILVFGGMALTS
jgi:hypothetical protein